MLLWASFLWSVMANLPPQFYEDYDNRGDTFIEVAQLLLDHHGQQYTQSEIASKVGVSQSRVSDFTRTLTDDDWINRHDGETTFVWNTEQHNPAETVATDAVLGLYRDLGYVLKKHTRTATGMFAVLGFCFFITAAVLLFFYILFRTGIGDSNIPPAFYLVIGLGLTFSGIIMTAITPLQALATRLLYRAQG